MGKNDEGSAASARITQARIRSAVYVVRPSTIRPPERLPATVIRELERLSGSTVPPPGKQE